jgi:hypothetical protein
VQLLHDVGLLLALDEILQAACESPLMNHSIQANKQEAAVPTRLSQPLYGLPGYPSHDTLSLLDDPTTTHLPKQTIWSWHANTNGFAVDH